jgi:cytochrome P450
MAQVNRIKEGENDQWKDQDHPTIFHAILDSKLPDEEKSVDRLAQDAQMLVMAGTLTTSGVLEVVAFWLLSQPDTLKTLKDELSAAIPNPNDIGTIPLPTLEALPYLTAVIKEGIRLVYGSSSRLQRIDPDNDLVYKDKKTGKEFVIPAGTPVGATAVQIHHNEDIYPDSKKFRPERWLGPSGRELERYMVSFNMGHRKCFGIHLAYAELYLTAAAIWRLWGSGGEGGIRGSDDLGVLTLFETGVRDIEIESDYFAPMPQKGSKGIRVQVHC